MNVKGKNIIITGGSLGIGKETARELVIQGANVLIHENNDMYEKHIEASNYVLTMSIPTLFKAVYSVDKRKLYIHLQKLEQIYQSTKGESD